MREHLWDELSHTFGTRRTTLRTCQVSLGERALEQNVCPLGNRLILDSESSADTVFHLS